MKKRKWNDEEIEVARNMLHHGSSFKDVALKLGRSQISVNNKMQRMGCRSGYDAGNERGKTKYDTYDWNSIQIDYDSGLTYRDIMLKYNLSTHSIIWGEKNGKLKLRTISESLKLAWKSSKFPKSDSCGIKRYRQLCEFKFNLSDYPDKFDFNLIKKYGWYSAVNRGNNINGISRDHLYSIKDGFTNGIAPEIISHPANCELVLHRENQKKKSKSKITLNELLKKIEHWDVSPLPDKQSKV